MLMNQMIFPIESSNFRCSENIHVILPSELDMKAEVATAKLWMDKCQAYLRPRSDKPASGGFLNVDDLKVHVHTYGSVICLIIYSTYRYLDNSCSSWIHRI